MPVQRKPAGTRDLSKRHAIGRHPFFMGKDRKPTPLRSRPLQEHGKVSYRNVVTTPEGEEMIERRRLNPTLAGGLSHKKTLIGTASELYLNEGIEKRGKGTRTSWRSRKKKKDN